MSRSADAVAQFLEKMDRLSAASAMSDGRLISEFRKIAADHLDRRVMAARALGSNYSRLNGENLRSYFAAYERHTEIAFLAGQRKYGASTSEVLGVRQTPSGVTVVVSVITTKSRSSDVRWYICRHNPSRVCDIAVDGARVSFRERTLFNRVLASGGLELLLQELQSGRLVELR